MHNDQIQHYPHTKSGLFGKLGCQFSMIYNITNINGLQT